MGQKQTQRTAFDGDQLIGFDLGLRDTINIILGDLVQAGYVPKMLLKGLEKELAEALAAHAMYRETEDHDAKDE